MKTYPNLNTQAEVANIAMDTVLSLTEKLQRSQEEADTIRRQLQEAEALVERMRIHADRLEWLNTQRPSLAFGAEEKGQPEAWGIYWTNKKKEVESVEATHLCDAIDKAKAMMDFSTVDLICGPLSTIREQQSAADAIEDRAALAGQVVVLREALEEARPILREIAPEKPHNGSCGPDAGCDGACIEFDSWASMMARSDKALALDIPQAAKQVAEWREKAELLELLVGADGKYAFGRSATAPGYFLLYKDNFKSKLLLDSAPIPQVIATIKAHLQPRAAKEASNE